MRVTAKSNHLQRVNAADPFLDLHYDNIIILFCASFHSVFPIVKPQPKKESELSKIDKEGAQDAKRDSSDTVKAAETKPSTDDSDIVQDTGNGSDDDGAENFNDVGG